MYNCLVLCDRIVLENIYTEKHTQQVSKFFKNIFVHSRRKVEAEHHFDS